MEQVWLNSFKIITDSRICSLISKGPKYRFQAHTEVNKCWETIASDLNDYCACWCKRERRRRERDGQMDGLMDGQKNNVALTNRYHTWNSCGKSG